MVFQTSMEKHTPLVSVLIPTYNAEKYITQALRSVLGQTYSNIEIIVVNDGSTDSTRELLETYAKKGVKVIHQSNKGQSAAANRAFYESQGELIKFFDADDLLSPDHIKIQVDALHNCKNTLAFGEWARFYLNPAEAVFALNNNSAKLNPIDFWLKNHTMLQCALWLIPREILNKSGLWDEQLSLINDLEFFTRVLMHSDNVKITPGARLYYRSGLPNSLSGLKSRKGAESAFLSTTLSMQHLLHAENSIRIRQACATLWQNFIYGFYPQFPDLIRQAEIKVLTLGGSNMPFPCGPLLKKIAGIMGWKKAKKLQLFFYAMGYKPLGRKFITKSTSQLESDSDITG